MGAYTEDDWDELRAIYMGMRMKVDRQFGILLSAVRMAAFPEKHTAASTLAQGQTEHRPVLCIGRK